MSQSVPLYRALSKLGYVSRTQANALIEAGEISINGKVNCDPEYIIDLETCNIFHKGNLIKQESLSIVLLYKPRGIITSRKDEKNWPTVYSLIPRELQNLHCVGRLDWATSGLLLLINNTQLSSWLTDPENEIPRVYL